MSVYARDYVHLVQSMDYVYVWVYESTGLCPFSAINGLCLCMGV